MIMKTGTDDLDWYKLDNILSYDAMYNIIYGERSNGKTYSVLKYALERYVTKGEQLAYLRRWDEDLKGKRAASLFDSLVSNDEVVKLTDGKYTGISYYSNRWYLCKYNEKGRKIQDKKPFCIGFSISTMEHDKGSSFPEIQNILFDEFLTRTRYIPDEFILFQNCLSTIIRKRKGVKIFMLGNTVNQYCPYFKEMGLRHIRTQKQGTIQLYNRGEESKPSIAVEYTGSVKSIDGSAEVYFAFDNPKLEMITEGSWEMDIYPHLPVKYIDDDIQFIYFIEFDEILLQCEIIYKDESLFTYIHEKTTKLKDRENDLIFTTEYSHKPNIRRDLLTPQDRLGRKIKEFFIDERVFYQNNEIGEVVRNYLNWCRDL